MTTKQELLGKIAQVSRSYAEDEGTAKPRQVVFRAIHDIVSDMEKNRQTHRFDYTGAVESMFRSACRQTLGLACDCHSRGVVNCQLLSLEPQPDA